MSGLDPIALLRELVAIPSVSGDEARVAAHLSERMAAAEAAVVVDGRNVVGQWGEGDKRLLFVTHIDTVPANPGWTRDPYDPGSDDDRVWGLGASDAGGSVVAMAAACVELLKTGLPDGCSLMYIAACDEEIGGEGMPLLGPKLPPIAGAVTGEPTAMDICPGQRGFVRMEGLAKGRAGHASRPWEGVNAIQRAARDIEALGCLPMPVPDPLLGPLTIQVTKVQGGTATNVIPAECRFTLDIRTIPECDNTAVVQKVQDACRSEMTVGSDRIRPCSTPEDAAIVQAAKRVMPEAPVRGFGGVSDMAFLGGAPAIV
ncbi:MAG: M20/M25/M40 family metallo-hydrolase, partial [Planctomycetota bacterium]